MEQSYVLWFEDIGLADLPSVGGKNASLGEMIGALSEKGVRVPGGFALTAEAYRVFVRDNGLEEDIRELLGLVHAGSLPLSEAGATLRRKFLDAPIPDPVAQAITEAYREMTGRGGGEAPAVAVRSSATAEDLPEASFAGQQETFLNVVGEEALLEACRRCFASLFTDRAINYRSLKGFDDLQVALSVGVQLMVRADVGASGVMFTLDTESGFPDAVVISATWGLGETVVQGTVDPDKYLVYKPFLDDDQLVPIIERSAGAKEIKLVYSSGDSAGTELVDTSEEERGALVLTDGEVLELARWAVILEKHYQRPLDIEWAKDGVSSELFIVQARPETVQSQRSATEFTMFHLEEKGRRLISGAAIGDTIAAGEVCVIRSAADIGNFRDGAILVAEMTDPDWGPVMKRAAGIITDHGGPTSHAAIISRELGVPAIVGTGTATRDLVDGQLITLSCAEGEKGHVYEGRLRWSTEQVDLQALPETRTKVMVNVASPAAAFRWWRLPVAGVGLARLEFLIAEAIRVHPMALAHPDRIDDAGEAGQIRELTSAYEDPREYFIDRLATGLGKLCAPYYPRPVIVRLSDFKTNEYAHLLGGHAFEPEEENPMLGFRGASRYDDDRYRDGFQLECLALKRVRETLGFTNLAVMVPFVRTVPEADRVIAAMAANGLVRGENGLEFYMMCEVPSNVVLAEDFAQRFDGFSIGSNDLTQLTLGADRDSEIMARSFDERDPAVKKMVADVIARAHACGITVGICGQGPSNYPEYAQFLVEQGIDSVSLNPDSVLRTVPVIAEAER
ncbi:phosphoenolpyruvate synthase [Corynebacterium comes]|uniref:Phosphoenolpyruvate synthase n=1 Tax=Corynebacterium comes TaxID=2675218 RepID=A0A6B8VX52_9CORY|nr:phosphoenolpyruvate synthase [Corynebacterium comes]QGU04297.1 Phosphoenolpyruvate synthase [Corynebacterium comes]